MLVCSNVTVSPPPPPQPSGSERQTGDKQEERERLRRVLKQMGRIKCPSEVLTPFLSSLPLLPSSFSFFCFLRPPPPSLASHFPLRRRDRTDARSLVVAPLSLFCQEND